MSRHPLKELGHMKEHWYEMEELIPAGEAWGNVPTWNRLTLANRSIWREKNKAKALAQLKDMPPDRRCRLLLVSVIQVKMDKREKS